MNTGNLLIWFVGVVALLGVNILSPSLPLLFIASFLWGMVSGHYFPIMKRNY